MKTQSIYPAEAVKQKDECHHHWVIESARGKNSKGKCRLCGKIKDFDNRGTEFYYDQEATPLVVEAKKPWQEEDEDQQWEVA